MFTLREHLGSFPIFGWLLTLSVFCVMLFVFVCFLPVSCVPNVASVSGLSILDVPFDFL